MIDRQTLRTNEYEDDGAGRLAILGVLITLAVIGAGIALNLTV